MSLTMLDFFRETETKPEDLSMATMVTGAHLRQAVESGELIQNGIPDSVEGVKYDFHLSSRILKAKFKRPVDVPVYRRLGSSALA